MAFDPLLRRRTEPISVRVLTIPQPSLVRLRGSIFRISGRSFPRRDPAEYPGDRLFPTIQSTVKTPLPYITKLLGSSIVGSEGSRCGPPPFITTPTGIKPTAKQHHVGAGLGGGQYAGVSEGGKGSGGGGPRSGGNPYSKTKSGGSMGRTPGGATARLDGGILERVQREGWPTCGLRNPNRNRSWSAGPGRRFSNFRRRRNRFCNYFSNLSSSLRN